MGNPTLKAQTSYLYQSIQDAIRTIIACASNGTGTGSISNNVKYWNVAGTPTTIFTPSTGAGIVREAFSRDFAFFCDGVAADLKKWNIDDGASNWGIAAPTVAPTIFATSSGSGGAWGAATIFSTMGLLVDSNNNIQYLTSINAKGTNTNTTVGRSGTGAPAFNLTPGGTATDGGVTWTNKGPISPWIPNHSYQNGHTGYGTTVSPAIVYDPDTQALYFNNSGDLAQMSGDTKPAFQAYIGGVVGDSGATNHNPRWEFLGSVATATTPVGSSTVGAWQPSHFYSLYGFTNNFSNSAVTEPTTVQAAYDVVSGTFTQTLYLQASTVQGTSAATGTAPIWSTEVGGFTDDGDLRWLMLGAKSPIWPFTAVPFGAAGTAFTAVLDTNSNLQVCIAGGATAGVAPTWPASYTQTDYGSETTDGATVIWAAVGPTIAWAASTLWFMPTIGFTAPATTAQFGGAEIIDSNSVLEACVITGKSAATAPVWPAVGNYVTESSGPTWFAVVGITQSSGQVTLLKGRYYYIIYVNSITQSMSDVSPVSVLTGAITNGQVQLSNIPVSPDSQADIKVILTTGDGGDPTILYYVTTIPNSQTSYTDNLSASDVLQAQIYEETDAYGNEIGVYGNQPPPNGQFPTLHKGRIWLSLGQFVYFSKALSDISTSTGNITGRYEEAFKPGNAIDISPGAEEVHGLLSDGYSFYIGTERHIRRIIGDDPTSFSAANVIFSEAGLVKQETWQIVLREGAPVGCLWLTPDFRVIFSDFNTPTDVGTGIQSLLNTINPAAVDLISFANVVSFGPYTFYALFAPTGTSTVCDTCFLFDMHMRQWYVWKFADPMLTGLYYFNLEGVPRWLVWSSDGSIRLVDPTKVVDKQGEVDQAAITSTIQTSWMAFGEPNMHKLLNSLELMTSDPNILVTVEASQSDGGFTNPVKVVDSVHLTQDILGLLKVFFVGSDVNARHFRFTFTSSSTTSSLATDRILSYLSAVVAPVNRI